MTKAKMPVAQHRGSRAEDARANRVWTEELTLIKVSDHCVDPIDTDLFAPFGRRSRGRT